MISSHNTHSARFLAKTPWALLGLLGLAAGMASALASCAADRQTTLLRSSRARAAGEVRTERIRQERELALWQATREQTIRDTAAARLDSARTSSQLRGIRSQLLRELDQLHRAERELKAARQRAAEIEQQLAPLRALEKLLLEQAGRIKDAELRGKALAGEVASATASAAKQEAQLKPRLAALQKRLAQLSAAGVTIAEVEAKIAAVQVVLLPPAAKAPAKPAAKKAKK